MKWLHAKLRIVSRIISFSSITIGLSDNYVITNFGHSFNLWGLLVNLLLVRNSFYRDSAFFKKIGEMLLILLFIRLRVITVEGKGTLV